MIRERHWSAVAERGSMAALRAMAWIYRALGRRACQLLLYPIVAYFFLRETNSRRASRAYLDLIRASPEGRRHLRGRPGFFAPFWHYHEFAVQLLDRMVLWGGGFGSFQMDHAGSEHLFNLARAGRGGILLGAHVGSFDMARQLAGEHQLSLNLVMFTAHAERINRFFEQIAPGDRVKVLQLDPTSIQPAFRIRECIKHGELVGILGDRIPPGGRERPIFVDFLGHRAPFPRSPFLLACVLGCPILLSICVRTGEARYETFVEPLNEGRYIPRQEREKAAEELAEIFVRRLEKICLRFPYQWFNFHDIWQRGSEL